MTKPQTRTRFTTVNIALISIFSAMWIVLNFTVAPLGFQLTRLPIVHGVISLFTLLLASWATGRYGVASAVGMIGSTIVLLAGGPLPVLGFAAASLLFDAILLVNSHRLNVKLVNAAVAVLATVVSSYFAGVLNGIFILNQTPMFAVTFWAGWTIVGGIIGLAIALPIIAVLEKANVKKVKAD
jgi:hypothetical protein